MNKTKELEEKVYDILFDLSDELGLKIHSLPEVYYVGKNFNFNKFGFDLQTNELIKKVKSKKTAFTLNSPPTIFSSRFDSYAIGEESGHYLHFQNVEIKRPSPEEFFAFKAIAEMLGFFSSKLVDSSRKNPYKKIEDFFPKKFEYKKSVEIIRKILIQEPKKIENAFYIQGYGLGEKMFNKYISGELPTKKIKKIFTHPLKEQYDAVFQFLHWKYEVLK